MLQAIGEASGAASVAIPGGETRPRVAPRFFMEEPTVETASMGHEAFRDLVLSLPDVTARRGEPEAGRLLEAALQALSKRRSRLTPADDEREMGRFREMLLPVLLQSDFGRYCFMKPRGYPGDYVTQEMIWLGRTVAGPHRYSGATPLGKLLTALTLDMPNCAANEARVRRLERLVRSEGPRIASVGCGSCIEFWSPEGLEGCELLLLDQDAGALERAEERIGSRVGVKTVFVQQNIARFILRNADDEVGRRTLVYASGLFDYFDTPSAKRLTRGLWRLVAPGGCLLLTNAHPGNPTRLWMEYAGDWFLRYKTEAEMRDLFMDLPGVASAALTLDEQGVYQDLEIRKER